GRCRGGWGGPGRGRRRADGQDRAREHRRGCETKEHPMKHVDPFRDHYSRSHTFPKRLPAPSKPRPLVVLPKTDARHTVFAPGSHPRLSVNRQHSDTATSSEVLAGGSRPSSRLGLLRRADGRVGERGWRIGLAIVGAVALLLRVAIVVVPAHFHLTGDPADYERHAAFIATGHGYPPSGFASPGTPSAFRPPAYPYLVGGLYAVAGIHPTLARLLGAALGVLTVLLIA